MTRTIDQVRDYLRTQVNHALRRLGVYGDETSLILLFDALAFTEGIDEEWKAERDDLRERGVFWPTGVRGAISSVFPDVGRGDSAIASVYAEFAHRAGWLTLDRTLTVAEHQELLLQAPDWCGVDRTMADLTATFGPPSVLLGPTSKLHSKTLVYAAADRAIICFHLWNGITEPETGAVHEEPVLLAVRIGGQLFPQSLIFTPEGVRLRPEEG